MFLDESEEHLGRDFRRIHLLSVALGVFLAIGGSALAAHLSRTRTVEATNAARSSTDTPFADKVSSCTDGPTVPNLRSTEGADNVLQYEVSQGQRGELWIESVAPVPICEPGSLGRLAFDFGLGWIDLGPQKGPLAHPVRIYIRNLGPQALSWDGKIWIRWVQDLEGGGIEHGEDPINTAGATLASGEEVTRTIDFSFDVDTRALPRQEDGDSAALRIWATIYPTFSAQ